MNFFFFKTGWKGSKGNLYDCKECAEESWQRYKKLRPEEFKYRDG